MRLYNLFLYYTLSYKEYNLRWALHHSRHSRKASDISPHPISPSFVLGGGGGGGGRLLEMFDF